MNNNTGTFVSISKYAKHYGISRQSVYNLIDRGELTRVYGLSLIDIRQKPKLRNYERK